MDKLKKEVSHVHLSNTEAILMTKMHSAALFLFFFFNNVAKPSLSPVHELPGSCNL